MEGGEGYLARFTRACFAICGLEVQILLRQNFQIYPHIEQYVCISAPFVCVI